jgi:chitinase
MDDFKGSCGMGKYPLINAMKEGLNGYQVQYKFEGPYDGPSVYQKKKKDRKLNYENFKFIMDDIMHFLLSQSAHEVTCDESEGHISYHRDYADCSRYYMCEGERKHHMPCPSNLVFNPSQTVCDWPENVEHCSHLAAKKDVRR